MGDERLVALVRAGDPRAFEVVFDRHGPGLLTFCRHMLGSAEEAEDAVQHTFFAAHRALLVDERPIRLKAWLYAIARNRCFSMLRARREEAQLDEDFVPSTVGLAAEVERREDLKAIVADLGRLPEEQRAALVLSELGAHSHDEIAEVLGVKREKVKALVFQARESLAGARTARETPCVEIREQLASARGGVLRRGPLRRHLEICDGCRSFRDEVSRQRAALAIILPVVPSLALKHAVLAGTIGGSGLGGGGAAAGGAALFGAGKGALAKGLAGVLLVGGGAGGYVAVHDAAHPGGRHAQVPAVAAIATSDPGRVARVASSVPAELVTPTATATPGLGAASATAQPTVLRGSVATRPSRHARRAHGKRAHHGHGATLTATTGTTGAVAAPGTVGAGGDTTGNGHGHGRGHAYAYGRGHGKGRPAKPAKPKHARKPKHAKRTKSHVDPSAAASPEFADSSPTGAPAPAPEPSSSGTSGAKHPAVAVDVGGVVPALPRGRVKSKP